MEPEELGSQLPTTATPGYRLVTDGRPQGNRPFLSEPSSGDRAHWTRWS
jgi:hypothetical protein